jgi:fructose-bisphosphate aldolase class II
MMEVCKERFEAFRTAGKASSIRVKRLPDMAKFYVAK